MAALTIERKPWQERCLVPSVDASAGDRMGAHAWFTLDTGNRNRFRPHVEWWDYTALGVWCDFGNGNSDPVWSVGVELRVPRWLARLLPPYRVDVSGSGDG